MDCPYCNNPLPPNVSSCPSCGAAVRQQPAQQQYAPPPPQQQYAPPPPPQYAQQQPYAPPVASTKSRVVYIVLGLFLGGLGIHNFYAGRTGAGVAQLIINVVAWGLISTFFLAPIGVLFLGIIGLWVLIEICAVSTDGQGRPFC